jgi:membrane fusion protein, multidrug efflux system
VDSVSRQVRLTAVFENKDDLLRTGMFLALSLALDERAGAVLVPEEAIVGEGAIKFVYVVKDGKAEQRVIETGVRQKGQVEVLRGLKVGEVLVVRGVQRLRTGAPVMVKPLDAPSGAAGSSPDAQKGAAKP